MARVFLGMPTYGEITPGAARGFFLASRRHQVERLIQQGSLLAANHNVLWCWALNNGPPDYFAMQHADVEPEDGWLDELLEELERHDLDVLGVALPIKDPRGLTSLAVGREHDSWQVQTRLTLSEVHRLPPTFTSAEVGGPLLINTGLWVCRFGAWTARVHFTIRDRIVRREGHWVPEVEPEDWYISRRFHELGLRVGATRIIRAAHRGLVGFANWEPWGQAFDADHVSASVIAPCNGVQV